MSFENFSQLLHHVFESSCSADLFAMKVWTIWFQRNKIRIAPPGFPLDHISQQAFDALMEYQAAKPKKPPAPQLNRP